MIFKSSFKVSKERIPRFMKIKKKDIKGNYNLKIKVNESVPDDSIFLMADDKLSEWRQEYTQKTGIKVELTETSFFLFMEWLKDKHPDWILYVGKIANSYYQTQN